MEHYGYIALFIGTFLEGETVLFLAGFLAHRGYFDLPKVVAIAFIGAYTGHMFFYCLGRWQGNRLLFKAAFIRRNFAQVKDFLERYGPLGILFIQFLYGTRIIGALTFGALRMQPRRFLFWEFLVTLFWASLVGGLGYGFGETLRVILGDLTRYEKTLLIYVLALSILYAGGHLIRRYAKAYRRNRLSLNQGGNNGKGRQDKPNHS